jgi:hypothetical protein
LLFAEKYDLKFIAILRDKTYLSKSKVTIKFIKDTKKDKEFTLEEFG